MSGVAGRGPNAPGNLHRVMTVKNSNSPMLAVNVIDRPLGLRHAEGASSDDAALIEAIRRGDPGSREALYHRYKRRVFALAVRIVGAMDAEEVSQEAFIRIFRGLPKFRGDSALGTWIYRLSVNAALSHRSRRGPLLGMAGEPEIPIESSARESPPAGDAVLRARLERALWRLPVGYRTVIVLHDIEGLEHEEVATILGCHVGTSKSQLHKARGKLREILSLDGITAAELEGR
jgi:RNA polymerase sigma-70 factor, ECF subfamily